MFDGATYTDTPTKQADVFSLEGLRDWLRTQPPKERYDYYLCDGNCLLDQYMAARGIPHRSPHWDYTRMSDVGGRPISAGTIACLYPRTKGAALARCEAEIEARDKIP